MLDRLTLDQLRTLVAVAETGSFSAAGRKLARVQSAISQTVQTLETALNLQLFDRSGKNPVLTEAGRVILTDARALIGGAERLRARAASIVDDVEPELTLAVDAMFPNPFLMGSLKVLRAKFPQLPVTVFTEGLGGAEQRLYDGAARLGLYTPRPQVNPAVDSEFLADIHLVPVVASKHPLAAITGMLTREHLLDQVQLVLTDRTQITQGLSGGIVSQNIWRFADLATRLEYLLAGFGWCNMPAHMVERHIDAGKLKLLQIKDRPALALPIHVMHMQGRPPGRAGRWLIEDLRARLVTCPKSVSVRAKKR